QGDYAYLLHIIRSMKHNGKAACILPHGVLFRGNAEAVIRTQLLKHGYIKAIIGLPANLFYGTGIPACIIVLDKEHAQARKGVFMIDASKGFIKDGPKNRLREQDIHLIVDTYVKQEESNPRFARLVSLEEIAQNEYNLNLPRYIDSSEAEDIQDIAGHLYGGIPAADIEQLQAYWDVCPNLKTSLFEPLREGYFALTVPATEVKKTIYAHHEFEAFMANMTNVFDTWRNQTADYLKNLAADFKPKQVIIKLSEDLLAHYRPVALLDPYNVYQLLMDYWEGVVQDDAYLIVSDGWRAKTTRIIEVDKKTKKEKDKGWRCDLVPKDLLVSHYFAEKQAELEQEKNELEQLQQQLLELEEEHSGDEGLLEQGIKTKDITELWNNEILEAASVLYANDFKTYQHTEQNLNQLHDECKSLEAAELIVENLINKGIKYSNTKQVTALAENFTDEQQNQLNHYISKQKQLNSLRKTLKTLFEDFSTKVCNKLSLVTNELPNADNLKVLQQWQNTYEAIGQAKERVKLLEAALDKMAYDYYGVLTETQIKQLVVDHKWLASLQKMIEGEVERVSQQLTQRVRELAERYAKTLPQLSQEVSMFEAQVNQHLAKMGFEL
ncbi:MAG TPA: N-6 DNA methylase, partial [Agitococcus sp.]|nr:N-6 DNA methylase [Agitococcus sp.]